MKNNNYKLIHKRKGKTMEINFERDCIVFSKYNINLNKLKNVRFMDFTFKEINLKFLYLDIGKYLFFFENETLYDELIKLIAGNPASVGNILRKYQNDFGVEHELWTQLVQHAITKFKINYYSYADDSGIPCTSDYVNIRYDDIFPRKIDDLQESYDTLVTLLPQNYPETKRKHYRQIFEKELKPFTDVCGIDLSKREAYLSYLEEQNGNRLDKWNSSKKEMVSFKEKAQSFAEQGLFSAAFISNFECFLDYCINYISNRLSSLNKAALLQQYGPVSGLKETLRNSINRLGFMDLLELHKQYKEKESLMCSKARQAGLSQDEAPYREYVDVYRLGAVLISDRMNQINKNKAKNKYIPQELIDEAMVFYYDTDSAEEAYSARSDEKYAQDKEGGDIGEQKVEYALKWLDKSYIRVEKRSKDRIGNSCILLFNPEFIDEKQEYDHLIVSKKGVFNIETKNYAGKLVIDEYGNWIKKKDGEEEGIKNPLQQIRQHEKLLKSFLLQGCNVVSIICIANDRAVIEGIKNSPIPIVKSDMLAEFIENLNSTENELSDSQVEQCVQAIYNHMVL